jgi:hypothetical protein
MDEARLSRRSAIVAGAGVAMAAAVGAVPARAADAPVGPDGGPGGSGGGAVGRAYSFLDAALDAYPQFGGTRLAQSYTDQAGLFSTAFVYDNALAALAYLADGRTARATMIGDALIFAQEHDQQYADGRVRQAYNVGPYVFYDGVPQPDGFVRADGYANIGWQFGFLGSAVGDVAWSAIALAALARRTHSRRYRDAAVRMGRWIQDRAYSTQPLGGYRFGVDAADVLQPFSSTEHNIDLIGLFGRLADLTGDREWRRNRDHAAAFVERMWDADGRFYYTGTNDGVTVNPFPIPEDTQTWSYLATRSSRRSAALDWEIANLSVLDTPERVNSTLLPGQRFSGVTFSSASLVANEAAPIAPFQPHPCRNGVWFEGNGHLALALRVRGRRGDGALARSLQSSSEDAQDQLGTGQTIGGLALPGRAGIVSASSPLDTGFGFGYYPYRHVGATAWYLMAEARYNPLDS